MNEDHRYSPEEGDMPAELVAVAAVQLYVQQRGRITCFLGWTCPSCGKRCVSGSPIEIVMTGEHKIAVGMVGYVEHADCGQRVSTTEYAFALVAAVPDRGDTPTMPGFDVNGIGGFTSVREAADSYAQQHADTASHVEHFLKGQKPADVA